MARSFRTDPRHLRAARRATFPAVRSRRASPGRMHPASAADVRDALRAFGAEAYYGLELVELVPAPPADAALPLGRLAGPGHIVLFDQPCPPWRLGHVPSVAEAARLGAAGAVIGDEGTVDWPGDTLRVFMLSDVLAHEVGHHVIQHERRLRGERATRTSEHEDRAEAIAAELRERLE